MIEFWNSLLLSTKLETDSSLMTDLIIASKLRDVKEGAQFDYPGSIQDSVFFVRTGLIRSYFEMNSVEHTDWFYQPGEMIVNELGFFHKEISDTYLEAASPSLIIEIRKEDYLALCAKYSLFNELSNLLLLDFKRKRKWYARLTQHVKGLPRYESFLEKFPYVSQSVQVQHVASFLGVNKNTMTRYRKADFRISKN